MTVRVDDLSSDVVAEGGARPGTSGPEAMEPAPWDAEDAYRAVRERVVRDAERTLAEAYSD